MPLKLNVGLTKKVGEANYGSRGASVHVELELDGSLAQEPAKLHEKIRQLFGLVRTSLAEELNGGNGQAHAANGNGNGASQPSSQTNKPTRPATQSQAKALYAIAKERGLNLAQFLRNRFQVRKAEELSIKQASEAIDALKATDKNGE